MYACKAFGCQKEWVCQPRPLQVTFFGLVKLNICGCALLQSHVKNQTLQIDQRPHGADSGDSAAQIRSCSERFNVLTVFVWNRPLASPGHFADISVPKLFRTCQRLNVLEYKSNFRYRHANWIFATVWPCGAHFADRSSKNARPSSRYSPAHFLSIISLNPLPEPRKQRPSFLDPPK